MNSDMMDAAITAALEGLDTQRESINWILDIGAL